MDPIDCPQRIGNLKGDVGVSMDPIDCPQEIGNPQGDIKTDMNPIDRPQRIGNLRVMLGSAWTKIVCGVLKHNIFVVL
ncbi:unnamed protein product [Prunus armeniaca]|uniref:Uncharacterized protein n=1 Tax=Prunus armeniaca TaxID=36596 RepID=A0A6J5XCK6_PRUAR|nr:unnamed protein product [Prunus armeniaca]